MNKDDILYLLAQRSRKRTGNKHYIAKWYGRRGGSSQRKYLCYLCDTMIDTESAKYPMTRHAKMAIESHGLYHLKQHNLTLFI